MKYLIAVFILLVAGMSSAQAERDDHSDSMRQVRERMAKIANKLEFSEEQRAETRALLRESFADIRVIREEMGTNMEAIKELSDDSNFDADSLATLANAQGDLFAQQLEIRFATRAAFNDILTDEQRERLGGLKEERNDRKEFLREQRRERREHFRESTDGV